MAASPTLARSYLFVPANRPERFVKANASGADRVIIDLEDAVTANDKDSARQHLADYLAGGGAAVVRINGAQTRWFEADLAVCGHAGVLGLVLPKTESAADVARVTARLPSGIDVLPLVETARAMENLKDIATAAGVARLIFGTVDFRTEMGIEGDDAELLYFRSMIVLASRAAGIGAPVDGVTVAIGDSDESRDALRAASTRGRRLGFGGKLCIHPSQVALVNDAYRPSSAQIDWARRVIAASASSPGAFRLDGEMVDAPVIARAEALLRQVDASH